MTLTERFAKYVLSGRRQAVFMALLFAILPLLGWIGIIAMALVTLRKGAWEGFIVLIWMSLPFVVILFTGTWAPVLTKVIFGSLLVWLLAVSLRHFRNWSLTLELAALAFGLIIFVAHLYMPDIQSWWAKAIMDHIVKAALSADIQLKMDTIKQLVQLISQYFLGMQASVVLFSAFTQLALARTLQARLFNPGGLQKEWLNLRLGLIATIITIACSILAFFGPDLFKDITPVLLLPFLIAGVSFIHCSLSIRKVKTVFITTFYILLALTVILFPAYLGILIIIAMLDSLLDFRKRL